MLSLTLQAQNNPFKIDDELYPVEALRKKHPMYGANADIHMANMAEYLPTYCRSGRGRIYVDTSYTDGARFVFMHPVSS